MEQQNARNVRNLNWIKFQNRDEGRDDDDEFDDELTEFYSASEMTNIFSFPPPSTSRESVRE